MSDPINFTRYTFERPKPPRVEIEMSAEQFTVMQRDSETYDQLTLTQLAEINPQAAYDRLHRIMGVLILSSEGTFNTESLIENRRGDEVESVVSMGRQQIPTSGSSEDTISEARYHMMNVLPDGPDGDFDLEVTIRLRPDEAKVFGKHTLSILDFSFRKSTASEQA